MSAPDKRFFCVLLLLIIFTTTSLCTSFCLQFPVLTLKTCHSIIVLSAEHTRILRSTVLKAVLFKAAIHVHFDLLVTPEVPAVHPALN